VGEVASAAAGSWAPAAAARTRTAGRGTAGQRWVVGVVGRRRGACCAGWAEGRGRRRVVVAVDVVVAADVVVDVAAVGAAGVRMPDAVGVVGVVRVAVVVVLGGRCWG
jgi:hypothetical protein